MTTRRTVAAPLSVRVACIPRMVAAGFVTGVRPGTPFGCVTAISDAVTMAAISVVPLVTASVAALFTVPSARAVPVTHGIMLIFGGLLRRSEPSPIATAAARIAVIGRRGGRSVHGLPRLERLTIACTLPQFGMCPEFPRPVGILHRPELSRQHPPMRTHLGSSGTARGPVSAACHPATAHRRTAGKPGARRVLPLSWRALRPAEAVRPTARRRTPEVREALLPYDRTRPYPQYLNTQPLNRKHFLRPGGLRGPARRTQFIGHGVRIDRGQAEITRPPAPARTPRVDHAPRTHRRPGR